MKEIASTWLWRWSLLDNAGTSQRRVRVVLPVEHLAACDCGAIVLDVGERGLYDRETFVSFKGAFYEN